MPYIRKQGANDGTLKFREPKMTAKMKNVILKNFNSFTASLIAACAN